MTGKGFPGRRFRGFSLVNALTSRYGGNAVILTYHMIVDRETYSAALDPLRRSMVTADRFEKQVVYISKRYKVTRIEDLMESVSDGRGERYAVIAFDDGYRSTLRNALPVLDRHRLPAVFYVTTSFPDEKRLWWLEAEYLLKRDKGLSLGIGGELFSLLPGNADEAEGFLKRVIMAGSASAGNRDAVTAALSAAHCRASAEALTWDDLRLLSANPLVTIGAHTHNHLVLSGLSREDAAFEMALSKRRLEEELGIDVRHFAYPFGGAVHAGQREFSLAAGCGFETAVTMRRAGVHREHISRMHGLPRYPVMQRDTPLVLGARLAGIEALLKHRGKRVVV